jgi:hypothetical protein
MMVFAKKQGKKNSQVEQFHRVGMQKVHNVYHVNYLF